MIKEPPTNDITLTPTNRFTVTWNRWFQSVVKALTGGEPLPLASYTIAELPTPTSFPSIIYVSNESGGSVPAFSDGNNWRRVTDRAIVT